MGTTIIDVRTKEEFEIGHIDGSFNIPLQDILDSAEEIKNMPPPLIFCCKSGHRSEMATQYFQKQGLDCSNGGGWEELQSEIR